MTKPITRPAPGQRQAWKDLAEHYKRIRQLHLRQLFADDPGRGNRLSAEAVGLYLDYSKNRITDETLKLLFQLAEESRLPDRIDAIHQSRDRRSHTDACPECGALYAVQLPRGSRFRQQGSLRHEVSIRRTCGKIRP